MTDVITNRGRKPYPLDMKRIRPYLAFIILALLVAGAVVYAVLGHGTPSAKVSLPSGEQAEVTPVEKMRVRTAEGRPDIDIATYRVAVGGLIENELSLTFDDVKAMPAEERNVPLNCVEGWTEKAIWKGPRLADVLERAGLKDGVETIIFSSPGGYTTSLTLEDIKETDPLLAYEVNGQPLPAEQGYPLRLVVPDRFGYKWIKWVVDIKAARGGYLGYWESRGYSNDARID